MKLTASQIKDSSRKMKKKPTPEESFVILKLDSLKIPYMTQKIMGFYILDFALPTKMLNIEVDGLIHDQRKNYDYLRDKFMEKCGYIVLRIPNSEVYNFNYNVLLDYPDKDDKLFKSASGKANSLRSLEIERLRKLGKWPLK